MTFLTDTYAYIYGALGIYGMLYALTATVLFVASAILFLRYGRIAGFRLSKRKMATSVTPPVSVVVPLFSDNSHFLDCGLRRMLEQKEVRKEVVVVYVGSNDDFYADLCMLSGHYPDLHTTQIPLSPKYPVSVKQAINIGIKAAQYSSVVVTYPSFTPVSDTWLKLMSRGFQYGDIVLGYGGIERTAGPGNVFARKFALMGSIPWLYAAVRGVPFGACSANLGYSKELYFSAKGFSHLNLNTGDGDLFLQKVSAGSYAAPVLSPRATVSETFWPGWKSWVSAQRLNYITFRYFPSWAKARTTVEPALRIAFYVVAGTAAAVMPYPFSAAVGILIGLHFLALSMTLGRIARRVGERSIAAFNPLFFIAEPVVRLYLILTQSRKEENAWR